MAQKAFKLMLEGDWSVGDVFSRWWWRLDGDALLRRARCRTGLDDFGDPPVEKPLAVLAASLESEADLHPLGRFLMYQHLLGILETRLRLAKAWRGQQEVLAALPVRRPVFITGMPRSGSTYLHELLARDPDNRSPKAWEVMFPLPAPEARLGDRDPRVRRAAACLWWFRRFAPEADSVYPLRACTPHECVAIHSYTLRSEEFASTCRIPSYDRFLRGEGLGAAYAWEKRFLQHLQSRHPTRQWILKSPDHLYALEEIFSVFPDAVIIQTHRNPLDVLKSSIRLAGVLHGLFGRPDDVDQLRDHEAAVLAEKMERAIRFRDQHPELAGRFVDISYTELVAEPVAVIERIYRHLERPLPETVLARMLELMASRSRYHKRRNPSLAELGLNAAEEARRFNAYCRRFGVSCLPEAG